MSVSSIVMSSHWGREVRHKYITQESKVLAVVFPGRNYSAERSLLDYASKLAREYGCDILLLEYGYQSARAELKREEIDIVTEECKAAVASLPDYEQLLFISKSMGSVIAGRVAAEMNLQQKTSHLYITPVADSMPLLRQSRGSIIYGGSDPTFTEEHAAGLSGQKNLRVYRIDDANHALEVGSVNESLAVLLVIINFYHEFFRDALTG
ncbi:hypothetical protein A3844_09245 [Paenibacillus helianthi]|uniref:Alpha/beta hydrolase n=1 Tax=Paenibacillus helianthi TaxID=1349432 RepID=A0ABX3EQA8_9BACL|nr:MULTISPECIES: hypothetical protein [Paenibacillus]OKP73874.1 hypothetical protein A3842_21270 [Paenibacillus sp. P3E]OKP87315.1 hypothetical protein A3848_20370 [Paenibacillus sp. P32E]OKP87984.1 hypothetical protein A3844_09245 [Paenibacillus helianthi]